MFYLGGSGSAALTWRTWSRTESPGNFVIDFAHCILFICFAYFVSCEFSLSNAFMLLCVQQRAYDYFNQAANAGNTHAMAFLGKVGEMEAHSLHCYVTFFFFSLFLNRYFFLFFLFIKFSIHHLVNFISYKSSFFFFFLFSFLLLMPYFPSI